MTYSVYGERRQEIDRLASEKAVAHQILVDGEAAGEEARVALLKLKYHHREFAASVARTKRRAIWEWRAHLRKHRNEDIGKKFAHPQTSVISRFALVCERATNFVEGSFDLASARTLGFASALWVGWDALIAIAAASLPSWLVGWSPQLFVGVSISAFTLLGFSFFTLFDIEVDWNWPPTIKFEWAVDPCQFVNCPTTDSKSIEVRIRIDRGSRPVVSDRAQPSLVYPATDDFEVWVRDSDQFGYAGFDRRPIALAELSDLRDVCRYGLIVAVGTASRAGSNQINERLSRARAQRIANSIERRMRCEVEPQVVALALWSPKNQRDDGFQRRIFAVAINQSEDQSTAAATQDWINETNSNLPLDLSALPNVYDRIDFCETPANCVWQPMSSSIP